MLGEYLFYFGLFLVIGFLLIVYVYGTGEQPPKDK